jgi:hypothetical protein
LCLLCLFSLYWLLVAPPSQRPEQDDVFEQKSDVFSLAVCRILSPSAAASSDAHVCC